MDTSETYIKMCEKAVPDIHYTGARVELALCKWGVHLVGDDVVYSDDKGHITWLPRQDQLQEMLGSNLWAKTLAFEFFLRKEGKYDINKYPYQFTSMEQLWLAFVMSEKFGKVWDNGDWVKR